MLVLESSSYVNYMLFTSDLCKPRCLALRWVLTEYLPLSSLFFIIHTDSIVSILYLSEFYASSLYITSGYEPGLPTDWNSARTHHNTTTSLQPHQLKTNSLPWMSQPAKRTFTIANTAKLQNSLQPTTIHRVKLLNSFFELLNASVSSYAKNSNWNL